MAFSAATVAHRLSTMLKPGATARELFFRCVNYEYVRASVANILTGQYAGFNGGRCNPPKSDPVCYLAGTQTNAAFEVEQEALLLGIRPANPPPRFTVGVSVVDAVLLDLTNPMVVKHLGLSNDASDVFMPSSDWKDLNRRGQCAPLQEVGAAARDAGYDGVRYPAVLSTYIGALLPGLLNVALFMDSGDPMRPARGAVGVELHDHGLLPLP